MIYRKFSKRQTIAMTWWNRPNLQHYEGILCDGAVRSGKTVCLTVGFFLWSMTGFNNEVFGICGKGDCKSGASHVGIVEKVVGNDITVIEGNYSNSVKRRTIEVNGRYIRGYIVPMYDPELPIEEGPVQLTMRVLQKGDTGDDVLALQILLKGRGCNGSMSKTLDGKFGNNTRGAVILFQRKHGLPQTGAADTATWKALLGVCP